MPGVRRQVEAPPISFISDVLPPAHREDREDGQGRPLPEAPAQFILCGSPSSLYDAAILDDKNLVSIDHS
jgi:hypothetical protein